ncbi:MAG: hypothetical protein A2X49_04110 [Lentisphaerae bacterium GWF2_52_8]|nr:MAG: hypothetical protein A2X49_04110 [Lentisphaerae bacterium GWF2_52_8]
MLKKRIIACLVVKDGLLVQSIGFERYLPVGRPEIAAEYLSRWGIDEIVLLDISAGSSGNGPDFAMIERVSQPCQVPLAVGGGIGSVREIELLLHAGADKVVLNRAAVRSPELVEEAAENFGNQCIVVSVDTKRGASGAYEVFTESGRVATGMSPQIFAGRMEERGAGEIFLTSIECDGAKCGYDMKLVSEVSDAVTIPLIVCGGVGHPDHLLEALLHPGVAAAVVGNFFHYTEHSVTLTKRFLRDRLRENDSIKVRMDMHFDYEGCGFTENGRLARRSDEHLAEIRFQRHEDVKI